MIKILIVEDEEPIANLIRMNLVKAGYQCEIASDGELAADAISERSFDLILLDIMLPKLNGYEVLEYAKSVDTPVIFLTAMGETGQKVKGLRLGAEDYIAKPFSVELLYQRIEAVLRRSVEDKNHARFHYKDMTVDFERMQVFLSEEPVKLSGTEYRILELLIRNQGRVVTRDTILQRIWDCDGNYVDENTLSVHIRRLRQKIEEDAGNPQYIITVFGIGYTFGEEA